jgi:hypothetical protein
LGQYLETVRVKAVSGQPYKIHIMGRHTKYFFSGQIFICTKCIFWADIHTKYIFWTGMPNTFFGHIYQIHFLGIHTKYIFWADMPNTF